MEIVDSMPNRSGFTGDWDSIAAQLQDGSVLKFSSETGDFPPTKATNFRTVLGSKMAERDVNIKTRQSEGALYVTAKN